MRTFRKALSYDIRFYHESHCVACSRTGAKTIIAENSCVGNVPVNSQVTIQPLPRTAASESMTVHPQVTILPLPRTAVSEIMPVATVLMLMALLATVSGEFNLVFHSYI